MRFPLLAIALLTASSAASAQDFVHDPGADDSIGNDGKSRVREGFHLTLGFGGGMVFHTSNIQNDYLASDLLIGGTIGSTVLGLSDQSQGLSEQLSVFGLGVDHYLSKTSGLHFGGTVGVAGVDTNPYRLQFRLGYGAAVWLGYAEWVSDEWSMGGLFRVMGGAFDYQSGRLCDSSDRSCMDAEPKTYWRTPLAASFLLTAIYN